eukprot:365219-Chlamydomonas_euryale.AAC.41
MVLKAMQPCRYAGTQPCGHAGPQPCSQAHCSQDGDEVAAADGHHSAGEPIVTDQQVCQT